ncbi:hypothetical protein CU012_1993 [Enterococcus faecium]|nr:hypothetical protein [Enterococcus faecium]MBL4989628.1 hypothetical protein [Enterococcus lactis]
MTPKKPNNHFFIHLPPFRQNKKTFSHFHRKSFKNEFY